MPPVIESVIPPEFTPRGYRLPKQNPCCARCAYCSFDPYNPSKLGFCQNKTAKKNIVQINTRNGCLYFDHISTTEEEQITRIHKRRPAKQE